MWLKIIIIAILLWGIVMPHGQPDYGAQAVKETVFGQADLGELAASLGSIDTFDRRGDIVWLDDFESDVLKWTLILPGVGDSVVASSEAARNGAFSAKLTTGNVIADMVTMVHYSPYPVTSRVGFEISFTVHNNLSDLIFSQRLYDGSDEHFARVRYRPATDVLEYLDRNAVWQNLATSLVLLDAAYILHTIKLVMDLNTQEYIRIIVDDVDYDLSVLEPPLLLPLYRHTPDPATTPHWEQIVDKITGVNANTSSYVDDAIVTQNEP